MDIKKWNAFAGNRLRAARQAAGIKQAELAQRTGFTQAYISSVETGKHAINLHRLLHIASILGVSPSDMLKGLEDKETIPDQQTHLERTVDLPIYFRGVEQVYLRVYQLVHTNPQSAHRLARAIGKEYPTLVRETNPKDKGMRLGLDTFMGLVRVTGDPAPLREMAQQLGYDLYPRTWVSQ